MMSVLKELNEIEKLQKTVQVVIAKQESLDARVGTMENRLDVFEEKVETDRLLQKEMTEELKIKVELLKQDKLKECKNMIYLAICLGMILIIIFSLI